MAHANLLEDNVRGQPQREAKNKKVLDYSMDSNNYDRVGDFVSPNTSNLYIPQDSAGMGVLTLEGKFAKQDATL